MTTRWIALLAAAALTVLPGCSAEPEPVRAERSLFAMNTYMTFTAYGENGEAAALSLGVSEA